MDVADWKTPMNENHYEQLFLVVLESEFDLINPIMWFIQTVGQACVLMQPVVEQVREILIGYLVKIIVNSY